MTKFSTEKCEVRCVLCMLFYTNNVTRIQQNEDNFTANRNHLFKIDSLLILTEES